MNSPSIQIISFNRELQSAVESLVRKGLAERWGFDDPSKNPDLKDIAAHYGNNFFVTLHDGEPVATGAILHEEENTARVVRMSVKSAVRGSGLGKQMLAHLERSARDQSYSRMVLETTNTWHDAIKFYESQGYRITHSDDEDTHFEKAL